MSNKKTIKEISTTLRECEVIKNRYLLQHHINYYFKAKNGEESLKIIFQKVKGGKIIFKFLIPKVKKVIANIFIQAHILECDYKPQPYRIGWISQSNVYKYASIQKTGQDLLVTINSKYLSPMKDLKKFLKNIKGKN